MANVRVNSRSYLRFTKLMEAHGIVFWDVPEFPAIPQRPDDGAFEVTDSNDRRLDTISQKVYGDPELWWVIALANDLQLIPTEMKRGMMLRIPASEFVFKTLLR